MLALVEEGKAFVHPSKYERIEQMRPWHRLGLAMCEVYGYSHQEAVDTLRSGKGKQTLDSVSRSPAGLKWRATIREQMSDPQLIVRGLLKLDSVEALADYYTALQWARDARDYEFILKAVKDVGLKRIIAEEERKSAPQAIHITVGTAGAAETETLEVDYELVSDEGEGG